MTTKHSYCCLPEGNMKMRALWTFIMVGASISIIMFYYAFWHDSLTIYMSVNPKFYFQNEDDSAKTVKNVYEATGSNDSIPSEKDDINTPWMNGDDDFIKINTDTTTTHPTTEESLRCTPLKNIVFLKTHKTASSTVQNVLMRYGLKHGLNFAMPKNSHDFNYPGGFSQNSVQPQCDGDYNIICHHMRFNKDQIKALMPSDSKYVSILREPLGLFESQFDYFWEIVPSFKKVAHGTSAEKWLDNAEEYVRTASRDGWSNLEKNLLFFDFGLNSRSDDESYMRQGVEEIDSIFDFMMISDYMDESMVLLSDLMCWDVKELACLKLNARVSNNDRSTEEIERVRSKVRAWNRADAMLFDYFNATFWRKVDEFGVEKMRSKVAELNQAADDLKHLCLRTEDNVEKSKIQNNFIKKNVFTPKGVKMTGYDLKPGAEDIKLCKQLTAAENPFSREIFQLQNLYHSDTERRTNFIERSNYIDTKVTT